MFLTRFFYLTFSDRYAPGKYRLLTIALYAVERLSLVTRIGLLKRADFIPCLSKTFFKASEQAHLSSALKIVKVNKDMET